MSKYLLWCYYLSRRKNVRNEHIQPLRSTDVIIMMWHQLDVSTTSEDVCLPVTSLNDSVTWSVMFINVWTLLVWNRFILGKSLAMLIFWAASWQNQQNGMCAQRKLRSAWASAHSDQSLPFSVWKKLESFATHWALSEDWSDWADAQADLSLGWVHSHLVGFVMRRFIFTYRWHCCSSSPVDWLRWQFLPQFTVTTWLRPRLEGTRIWPGQR